MNGSASNELILTSTELVVGIDKTYPVLPLKDLEPYFGGIINLTCCPMT